MALTRRSRLKNIPIGDYSLRRVYPRKMEFSSISRGTMSSRENQITDSESHQWPPTKDRRSFDVGGDFWTQRQYMEIPFGSAVNMSYVQDAGTIDEQQVTYIGPLLAVMPPATVSGPTSTATPTLAGLDQLGTKAVNLCAPTNSVADASTFLGELVKDGLPRFLPEAWKSGTDRARRAGSDYLNVEFGWKPILSDIEKFARGVTHARSVLSQYERDAGKLVRRRFEFPLKRNITHQVIDFNLTPGFGVAPENMFFEGSISSEGLVRVQETVQRRWFSGAFTYHLPSGYDSRNALDKFDLYAKKILGIVPTPDDLWELAPWSWGVDWFSSAGDVFSNLSSWASDGLVLRYGYMMEHTIDSVTTTQRVNRTKSGAPIAPVTLVTETKMRRRANPFGFGISWNGLSPRQLAIAAALGLTKS